MRRLVDLEAAIREHYLRPGFRGRTSTKKVLPVLVTAVSYEGLAIADGDKAAAVDARIARGHVEDEEPVRHRVREYCKQNTLAMAVRGPVKVPRPCRGQVAMAARVRSHTGRRRRPR